MASNSRRYKLIQKWDKSDFHNKTKPKNLWKISFKIETTVNAVVSSEFWNGIWAFATDPTAHRNQDSWFDHRLFVSSEVTVFWTWIWTKKFTIITGRYVRTTKVIIERVKQMYITRKEKMENFEVDHLHSVRDSRTNRPAWWCGVTRGSVYVKVTVSIIIQSLYKDIKFFWFVLGLSTLLFGIVQDKNVLEWYLERSSLEIKY